MNKRWLSIVLVFISLYILVNFVSASAVAYSPGEVFINVYAYCSDPEYQVVSSEVKCEKRNFYQIFPVSVSKNEQRFHSALVNAEGWWLRCEGGHSTGTIVLTCCKDKVDQDRECDCETVVKKSQSWGYSGREYQAPVVVNRSKKFEMPNLIFPNSHAKIGAVINIELFDGISHDCIIKNINTSEVLGTYGVTCNLKDVQGGYSIFSTDSEGRSSGHIFMGNKNYSIVFDFDTEDMVLQELITINKKSERFECVFENSYSIQECYLKDFGGNCLGIDNCYTNINYWDVNYPNENIFSQVGKEVEWTSSCGNVSMILEDDMPKKIIFDCKEKINSNKIIDCETGYYPKYLSNKSKINNYLMKNILKFKKFIGFR
jgi:hypothetical protein